MRDYNRSMAVHGLTVVVIIFAVVAAFPFSGECRTEIKVASVMPEGSPWTLLLREMAADIEARTKGNVAFSIYAGGVSGDEADVIRKMRVSRIHAAGFTGVGLGLIVPQIRVLESPFLFRDQHEVDHVKNRMFETFETAFAEKGYVFLGYVDGGGVYLFSKTRLAAPEDFKIVKMWLWKGDTIAEAFLDIFQVKAYPLNVADVNTGLETGMIDAFYSVPVAAVSFQWYWRIQYMLDYPIVNSTGGFLMNRRVFETLSDSERAIVRERVKHYCAKLVRITRDANLEAKTVIADAGIEQVAPTAAQKAFYHRKAAEIYQKYIPSLYSRALLEKIQDILKAYRDSDSR